jgi:uncharacterized protein YjiS (DUF1127 family)
MLEVYMTTFALHMSHLQVSLRPVAVVGQWLTRRRNRQELLALDDEQLTDVGLSRDIVLEAANKPLWSA